MPTLIASNLVSAASFVSVSATNSPETGSTLATPEVFWTVKAVITAIPRKPKP